MSFFAASKSARALSRTLDASCHVVYPRCSALMASFANSLKSDSQCGADYRLQNPIVRSAYSGLISYDLLFKTSCFKATGVPNNDYCFSNAITNTSAPSDSYIYYLPLGMPIPGGSVLTCSDCLKRTMQVFQTAAANKTQPLNGDYGDAARMVNVGCGPGFVNSTVATIKGQGSGCARTTVVPSMSYMTLLATMVATGGALLL